MSPARVRATAFLALLCVAEHAAAGNLLRKPGQPAAASAADLATAQAAIAQAQQAAAAQAQAQGPLRRAREALQRFQAAQAAARLATRVQASAVPDGLATGGLQVAAGAGQDPSLWQGAALPVASSAADGRTDVTITQQAPKAILTWDSFNVGARTHLAFDQSAGGAAASSWIALNRVVDPTAQPSTILGSITAPGQVYLVNRNGIFFGGGAQVGVSTLVVSGVDFTGALGIGLNPFAARDATFRQGLAQGTAAAATVFSGGGGAVTVSAGAQLQAGALGQVILVGSGTGGVSNQGAIAAPDGQVLLTAGEAVALQRAPDGRGYDLPLLTGGGLVENGGTLAARRGDITLVGGEVRQDGLITSTTGAKANGSVRILADGHVTFGPGSVTQILPDLPSGAETPQTVVGILDLGIDPTTGKDTRSQIQVTGRQIDLLQDASLYAPAGNVHLLAQLPAAVVASRTAEVDAGLTPSIADDTRVYLADGARIDVSGLAGVQLPMSRNTVEGELRAAELRDNPVLRDSPLRSRSVYFDPRQGVQVADLSGYVGLVARDVRELMTRGGDVSLAADAIVTRQGSAIDLSGGSLRYLDGTTRSSVLIDAAGRRVAIEDAQPGIRYVGLDGDHVVTHARWGVTETFAPVLARGRAVLEPGYVQGSAAGSLTLTTADSITEPLSLAILNAPLPGLGARGAAETGRFRILDGDLIAATVVGPHQVTTPPAAASLTIDRSGDVTIAASAPLLGGSTGPDSPLDPALQHQTLLPAGWFQGTLSSVRIKSGFWDDAWGTSSGSVNYAPGGHLTIPAGVNVDLGGRGSFSFTGKGVEIAGTLRAAGGTLALQALDLPAAQPGQPELGYGALARADLPTIHLAPTGILDASGDWTNERLDGASGARPPVSGGAITLTSTNLLLDTGSLLAVGGGARLDATGRTLTRGNGGSLALDVTRPYTSSLNPAIQTDPFYGRLVLGSTLEGYALGTGARLAIATPYDVTIVGTPPADGGPPRLFTPGFAADAVAGALGADFFTRGGFASFALVAERGITLTAGTVLHPSTETLVVPERLAEIPGGTRFADFAPRQVLPEALRQPMSLSLSTAPVRPISADFGATPGAGAMDLVVEAGARLQLDTGSSVALSATGTLYVDGVIQASAGSISLTGVDPFLGKSVGLTRIGPASVRLGPEARLLAPGATQVAERGPLEVRSVLPGGKIALAGNEVLIDQAAVLDASGVAGVADLPAAQGSGARGGLVPVAVDGAGGSISVSADGGLLAGQLRLGAGGASGAGGSLSVTYASRSGNAIPLVVTPTVPAGTATVGLDGPAPRTAGSQAPLIVAADALRGSGADALTLATAQPGAPLLFDGDVTLEARRSLVLGAAVLGVRPGAAASDVQLDSGYVRISGVSQGNAPAPTMTTAATSHLTVQADDIDVMGSVSLGCAGSCQADGFATAHLGSATTTDLRLSDHDATGAFALAPGLRTAGALELQAAQVYAGARLAGSQLYGDRAATDPGFLVSSPVSITVQGNDLPAATPLSFGERLTLRAPVIQQGGVLRAPQGQLRLEGWAADGSPTGSITLLPGSVTSASLGGALVPFAAVGSDGSFLGYDTAGSAPTKSILIDAGSVTVSAAQAGLPAAVVDVSGGGDVRGFNFTSGNGGSRDVLASGGYAILPGVGQGLAPLAGAASFNDATLAPGAAVRLQGVPGLADGWYTLLPAHDALLPGGLLVQPAAGGSAAPLGTAVRDDGALVVSGQLGYRVAGGAYVADAPFTRFVVMPRSVYGQYSELRDASLTASALALAGEAGVQVRTPLDAGGVALRAGRIDLQGTGRFGGAPGGLPGNLDIAADQIAVTTVAGEAPPGALVLDPRALEAFGAGSLLLGGTRTDTATGTQVDVRAQHVLVDTAGAAPLTLPEIVLVATGDVTVAAGSSLRATGPAPAGGKSLQLQGDGALLRLSSADRVDVLRGGASGATGQVILGAGSTLAADGSLSLDASRQLGIAPDAVLTALQLDLSATRLNLGDAPAGTPGTTLGSRALAQLASASQLLFRAPEIDLFGSLSIGGTAAGGAATLGQLTLDAGLVQGQAGPATLTAGGLALQNSTGAASAGVAGSSTLTLQVGRLTLGPGDLVLSGYDAVTGTVGVLDGRGRGSLTTSASVSLGVGQVTTAGGADTTLRAGGSLTLEGGPTAPAAAAGLGGRLALEADAVRLDTSIRLPAGSLEASARTGALVVGPAASIQVGGQVIDFRGVEKVAPAGSITLSAATDLDLRAGAALDVSGTSHGGDAGRIQLTAGGTATLDGSLVAAGGGGAFSIDAARLGGGFEALGAAVEGARGFDAVQRYHLRGSQEDLTLASGRSVTAHQVSLISDGGAVTVAGTIAAAGSQAAPTGGRIELSGGAGVVLGASAVLDARAATAAAGGFQPSSGAVLLEATGGRVDVAPGATIDLGGGRQGGGTLVVRAPRDGVDVAVDRLGARIVGARQVVVQGVATYGAAAVDRPLV
jgi:filamentous hemagglutinin